MPEHDFEPARGRLEKLTIASDALQGNLLGDPTERVVTLYLPEDYDDSSADYPLFVDLAGFLGSGPRHVCWQLFGASVPQRLDRLVGAGKMGPVVAVFPDCFTSLGGNQYIDSIATGRWASFLVDEMIPQIEQRFRVRRGRGHRALFGKSSGGYGALVHGMKYAEHWGAIACHSGDVNFDLIYRRDMPLVLDMLARYDGDVAKYLEHLAAARKTTGEEKHALMLLAMAATYDPDPEAPCGIRLPVDPRTAELDLTMWRRWLAHDPLTMIDDPLCQENLRRLSAVFIDCGSKDQYHLHYGARALVRKLEALEIPHHYEEFDDNHTGVDYRMDVSLPLLYRAVT